jgi:very-short-patch-repair endonuclease
MNFIYLLAESTQKHEVEIVDKFLNTMWSELPGIISKTVLPTLISIIILLICAIVFKTWVEKFISKKRHHKYYQSSYNRNKNLDKPAENEYDRIVSSNNSVQDRFIAKSLMTDNEREFYQRLTTALPQANIFPQVALSAILKTENFYSGLRNKFTQKVADYIITDKDFKIIAIIELDDKTHRKEKDAERDNILKSAGYNIIRYQSREKPTPENIRQDLILLYQ